MREGTLDHSEVRYSFQNVAGSGNTKILLHRATEHYAADDNGEWIKSDYHTGRPEGLKPYEILQLEAALRDHVENRRAEFAARRAPREPDS